MKRLKGVVNALFVLEVVPHPVAMKTDKKYERWNKGKQQLLVCHVGLFLGLKLVSLVGDGPQVSIRPPIIVEEYLADGSYDQGSVTGRISLTGSRPVAGPEKQLFLYYMRETKMLLGIAIWFPM